MYGAGIKLVDFKIEIGRIWDGDFMRLIVADEISPDSCRLWDIKTGQKLDKDVFRAGGSPEQVLKMWQTASAMIESHTHQYFHELFA